jgi:hypothetical protein
VIVRQALRTRELSEKPAPICMIATYGREKVEIGLCRGKESVVGLFDILRGAEAPKRYQMAIRQIDTETVRRRPSWLSNSKKEKDFFDGVIMFIRRGSIPIAYAMHGFMSPQSAEVLFSFAANLELQGASFTEQQMASAKFIEEAWAGMSSEDKDHFLRVTAS